MRQDLRASDRAVPGLPDSRIGVDEHLAHAGVDVVDIDPDDAEALEPRPLTRDELHVAFARRATAPAWFSTGLMDEACPPSTTFGAYHAYAGPKDIQVWDYNGHEAGGSEDLVIALALAPLLAPGRWPC